MYILYFLCMLIFSITDSMTCSYFLPRGKGGQGMNLTTYVPLSRLEMNEVIPYSSYMTL
jgi:hypothetical protein